jgi:hypothetical protein
MGIRVFAALRIARGEDLLEERNHLHNTAYDIAPPKRWVCSGVSEEIASGVVNAKDEFGSINYASGDPAITGYRPDSSRSGISWYDLIRRNGCSG